MSADVRHLTHVLYPAADSVDDEGPWTNPTSQADVANLIDHGYAVVSTTSLPLHSAWGHDGNSVTEMRVMLLTTLVRP